MIENVEIIPGDFKVIKNVEEYFNNKVESLSLSKDPEHVSGTSGLSVREALIMWLRQKKNHNF